MDRAVRDDRALRWPDALPAADLGLRRALGTREVEAAAEPWRPWRAYGTMHSLELAVSRRKGDPLMNDRVYTMSEGPLGLVVITADGGKITSISLRDRDAPPSFEPERVRDDAALAHARAELEAYFAGTLRDFTLPLAPEGTPFQRRVWDALCRIPYGETTTYGEIAAALGIPSLEPRRGCRDRAEPDRDRDPVPPRDRP